jgi:raffinose/stachyose/melibiose transport system permease protein
MEKMLRSKKAILFFEAPALLLFTLILFVPIINDIWLSFCNYDAINPAVFCGVENFVAIFKDPVL